MGQTVVEILQFSNLRMVAISHLGFSKFQILAASHVVSAITQRHTKFHQN